MKLIINGSEAKYLRLNGTELERCYLNGTQVFRKFGTHTIIPAEFGRSIGYTAKDQGKGHLTPTTVGGRTIYEFWGDRYTGKFELNVLNNSKETYVIRLQDGREFSVTDRDDATVPSLVNYLRYRVGLQTLIEII